MDCSVRFSHCFSCMKLNTLFVLAGLLLTCLLRAEVKTYELPAAIVSSQFQLRINGHPVTLGHAAAGYHFASFDLTGSAEIEISASDEHFWDGGVEVQPWRHGIRPE